MRASDALQQSGIFTIFILLIQWEKLRQRRMNHSQHQVTRSQ
jgi:hypothetical protein